MISPPAGVQIWLAAGATDMRRGFDGLAALIAQKLNQDPFSGALFIFRGCQIASKSDPHFGVRPWRWTDSGRCFDRLLGVLNLELHRAEIAQCRVQPS